MEAEVWKNIDDTDGFYQISNHGRVKTVRRGGPKILKLQKNTNGYYELRLFRFDFSRNTLMLRVGRLVGQYFVPNPSNKFGVNHIDGNKLNDHHKNIEWVTIAENLKHAARLGLNRTKKAQATRSRNGKLNGKVTMEVALKIRKEYVPYKVTQEQLAKKYGVSPCTIQVIVTNKFYLPTNKYE